MQVAVTTGYLLVPYSHADQRQKDGSLFHHRRWIPLNLARDGVDKVIDFHESEIAGDSAVIKVDCDDDATLTRIGKQYQPLTKQEVADLIAGSPRVKTWYDRETAKMINDGVLQPTREITSLDKFVPDREGGGPRSSVVNIWSEAEAEYAYAFVKRWGFPPIMGGAFPTTSVIDNFTGADAALGARACSNGTDSWANARFDGSAADLAIVSNRVASGSGFNAYGDNYITASRSRTPNGLELYFTIGVINTAGDGWDLYWCGVAGAGTADGYAVSQYPTNTMEIDRVDNETFTTLGGTVSYTNTTGHKHGIQHDNDGTIHLMRETGGGWTEITTRSETTYSSGVFALDMDVTSGAVNGFDDLGGGVMAGGGAAAPVGKSTNVRQAVQRAAYY